MDDTTREIMDLAARRFGADAAGLRPGDDLFETLGIDSLKALSLLSELELHFGVEIPDWELQEVRSFSGLAEVVHRLRGG